MADALLENLERTRPEHRRECRWHRLLVDSYTGGGGYESKCAPMPEVGYWGPAASIYAATASAFAGDGETNTYLDRHPREDSAKFAKRLEVANYLNYVEPLTDLKVSYLLRKPVTRQGEAKPVTAWREDIDGTGTTWDDLRPSIVTAAAIVGWVPVLFDRPAFPGSMSKAQAAELGLDRWIIQQLAPSNLLEWKVEGGVVQWVKIRTCYTDRERWDSTPEEVEVYTIWTPTDATRFEVRNVDGKEKAVTSYAPVPHNFGRVPLAIFRHKRVPMAVDPNCFGGLPMHGAIARVARRLFNLTSEFDEHIRSQVFAVLVLAMRGSPQQGEINIGAENGLILDPESSQQHYYLAPPPSVAETLDKRTLSTVQEIYRIARVEFARATVSVASSGVARAYDFAQTNQAIADFGAEIARGEQDAAYLIARGDGLSHEQAVKQRVIPASEYGIDDLAGDMKLAADAVTMKLGPTATVEVKVRAIDALLPQLDAAKRKAIRAELEKQENEPPPAPPPLPGPKPPAPTPPPAPPPA